METLLQLNSMLKKIGVRSIITFFSSNIFTAGERTLLCESTLNDLRVGTLNDGIILLRYIEEE